MKDCRRFEALIDADYVLSPEDNAFLQRHREECELCRTTQEAADEAFSFLRESSAEDTTGGYRFETKLLRRYRVQRTKEGFRYWMPAFFGAAAASVALFAALTLVTQPRELKPGGLPTGQARATAPKLELNKIPRFTR